MKAEELRQLIDWGNFHRSGTSLLEMPLPPDYRLLHVGRFSLEITQTSRQGPWGRHPVTLFLTTDWPCSTTFTIPCSQGHSRCRPQELSRTKSSALALRDIPFCKDYFQRLLLFVCNLLLLFCGFLHILVFSFSSLRLWPALSLFSVAPSLLLHVHHNCSPSVQCSSRNADFLTGGRTPPCSGLPQMHKGFLSERSCSIFYSQ